MGEMGHFGAQNYHFWIFLQFCLLDFSVIILNDISIKKWFIKWLFCIFKENAY